jgi:hypothetical protein
LVQVAPVDLVQLVEAVTDLLEELLVSVRSLHVLAVVVVLLMAQMELKAL